MQRVPRQDNYWLAKIRENGMTGVRDIPADQLSELEAIAELAALAEQITSHDSAYHQEDAPVISDAAYDELRNRNLAIEAVFPI